MANIVISGNTFGEDIPLLRHYKYMIRSFVYRIDIEVTLK